MMGRRRSMVWLVVMVTCMSVIALLRLSLLSGRPSPPCNSDQQPDFMMEPLFPSTPYTVEDHVYFSAWDGIWVYENKDSNMGNAKRLPGELLTSMLSQAQSVAIQYLREHHHRRKYTVVNCQDIRYRQLPTIGVEVDVLCRGSSSLQVDRVTLVLPQAKPHIAFHTRPTATAAATAKAAAAINIVLPLTGRRETFQQFLADLQEAMAPQADLQLGLTVVYIEDGGSEAARATLESATAAIPRLHTDFLLLPPQKFSRARALKVGVEQSNITAPVVFLCDADVMFTNTFLTRCLATPVRGSQVYFPVAFSQYNPALLNPLGGTLKYPQAKSWLEEPYLDDNFGFWRLWGHGMVCIYKSDFVRIDGFNPNQTQWGGEDVTFLKVTARMGYKIVRSLDYGLFHRYHPKNCSAVGQGHIMACLRVKAIHEASSLTLGMWQVRNEVNTTALCSTLKTKSHKRVKEKMVNKTARHSGRGMKRLERRRKNWRGRGDGGGSLWSNVMCLQIALLLMITFNIILLISLCNYRHERRFS